MIGTIKGIWLWYVKSVKMKHSYSKPTFTREELIEMRRNNPKEYKRRQPEIQLAYAEGRVRFEEIDYLTSNACQIHRTAIQTKKPDATPKSKRLLMVIK